MENLAPPMCSCEMNTRSAPEPTDDKPTRERVIGVLARFGWPDFRGAEPHRKALLTAIETTLPDWPLSPSERAAAYGWIGLAREIIASFDSTYSADAFADALEIWRVIEQAAEGGAGNDVANAILDVLAAPRPTMAHTTIAYLEAHDPEVLSDLIETLDDASRARAEAA